MKLKRKLLVSINILCFLSIFSINVFSMENNSKFNLSTEEKKILLDLDVIDNNELTDEEFKMFQQNGIIAKSKAFFYGEEAQHLTEFLKKIMNNSELSNEQFNAVIELDNNKNSEQIKNILKKFLFKSLENKYKGYEFITKVNLLKGYFKERDWLNKLEENKKRFAETLMEKNNGQLLTDKQKLEVESYKVEENSD